MTTERGCILVIDDEFQIRRFLRISLASQGFDVLEAASAEEGLSLARTHQPDLVLLDLGLPDMDGFDTLQALRTWSTVPVLVVSVRSSEEEKVRLLEAGAHDYVTKPFGIRELLARIRVNLRERLERSSERPAFALHGLTFDMADHRVSREGVQIHLTPKEFAVLEQLVDASGRVVTQAGLLRDVWGPVHEHDSHYLRVVVGRLRAKLGDDPAAPRVIITEAGIGYRFGQ